MSNFRFSTSMSQKWPCFRRMTLLTYVIQKKVVRIIHHEERLAHTNCLFKQMHLLKFQDLFKYRTAIIMFKLHYGKLPTLLQSTFKRSQNIHNTRSRNTFIVRSSRTNLKAMCISALGVKLWNTLPVYSVLPRPFLQGATPCPFLVTPCIF